MYGNNWGQTGVKSHYSTTIVFSVTIGLHQGSTVSLYHFALIMDEVTINV